jgi:hypothetical protein
VAFAAACLACVLASVTLSRAGVDAVGIRRVTALVPDGAESAAADRDGAVPRGGDAGNGEKQAQEPSTPGRAMPVRVTTAVEPKDVTIGQPFRFTIRIESDPGVEVAVPLLTERLGDHAIVDFGHQDPVERADGKRVSEHWYDLVAYETGSQYVPAITLGYKTAVGGDAQRLDTPKAVVNVESLITTAGGADDVPDIREAVPIVAPGEWAAWAAAGVAAAAALLAYLGYRRWRGGRAERRAPLRPAHELALEALAGLRLRQLIERGEYEAFYVAVTDIVRRYIEARFGLRAPEMTTDEFLAAAQRSRDLVSTHRAALQDFLAEADLVKFARYVPTRERAERAWSAADEFVRSTKAPEAGRAAA